MLPISSFLKLMLHVTFSSYSTYKPHWTNTYKNTRNTYKNTRHISTRLTHERLLKIFSELFCFRNFYSSFSFLFLASSAHCDFLLPGLLTGFSCRQNSIFSEWLHQKLKQMQMFQNLRIQRSIA